LFLLTPEVSSEIARSSAIPKQTYERLVENVFAEAMFSIPRPLSSSNTKAKKKLYTPFLV